MKIKHCAHGGRMHCNYGCYADGGEIGVHRPAYGRNHSFEGTSHAGHYNSMGKSPIATEKEKENFKERAKDEHKTILEELKSMPKPKLYAEGGEADLINSVLKKRHHYSEGGRVANSDEPEADFMVNDFDDLALRDSLHDSYTEENSGDDLSCDDEDERRRKMVAEIMASRRQKDRNPRLA